MVGIGKDRRIVWCMVVILEVRNGVLLGSMGDALAAITRVASVTKVHSITHILTIANQPLDWSIVSHSVCDEQQNEPEPEVSGEQHDQKTAAGGNGKKEAECEDGEGGEIVGRVESEGEGVEEVEMGGGSPWIPDDVCVSAGHGHE